MCELLVPNARVSQRCWIRFIVVRKATVAVIEGPAGIVDQTAAPRMRPVTHVPRVREAVTKDNDLAKGRGWLLCERGQAGAAQERESEEQQAGSESPPRPARLVISNHFWKTSGKDRTRRARRPSPNQSFPSELVTIALVMIVALIVMMVAVFTANVMAMDPLMVVIGPMAPHPNHFVVARPIARAVAVVRPVADLNAKALRSRSGRKKNTGRNCGDQQKFFRNHNLRFVWDCANALFEELEKS
jgi:hypothetical protein